MKKQRPMEFHARDYMGVFFLLFLVWNVWVLCHVKTTVKQNQRKAKRSDGWVENQRKTEKSDGW